MWYTQAQEHQHSDLQKRGKLVQYTLEPLGLSTLEERRQRGDLIETYKIITSKKKVCIQDFFHFYQSNYDL